MCPETTDYGAAGEHADYGSGSVTPAPEIEISSRLHSEFFHMWPQPSFFTFVVKDENFHSISNSLGSSFTHAV